MKGKKILSVFLSLAMMLSLLIFGGTNFTAEELKNLATNPGFEDGTSPWVGWGPYTLAESSVARTGVKSLEALSGGAYGGARLFMTDIYNTYGAGDYTLTIYGRAKTENMRLALFINDIWQSATDATTSGWVVINRTFTLAEGLTEATIMIIPGANRWDLGFYLDDFTLTKAGVYEPTPTPETTATPTPEPCEPLDLATNPGFEDGTSPWVGWGPYTLAESSIARTGVKSLEAVAGGSYGGARLIMTDIYDTYGAGDYTLKIYGRAKTENMNLALFINDTWQSATPATTSGWVVINRTFTLAEGLTDPSIMIIPGANRWDLGFYLDDFTLTKDGVCVTPTPEPTATPTVAPTATPTVAPTATPTVAPTATPTPEPCEPLDLATNPGFEDGTSPWVKWGGYELAEGSEARTGSKSLEAVPNTNSYGGPALFLDEIFDDYGAGDYTITFYAKAKTENMRLRLFINSVWGTAQDITTSSWTVVTHTFTLTETFYPDNPAILITPRDINEFDLGFYMDDISLTKDGVCVTPTAAPTAAPTEAPCELLNLLPDPSFEGDQADILGFYVPWGAAGEINSVARTGSNSLKITADSWTAVRIDLTETMQTYGDGTYTLSFYVRAVDLPNNMYFTFKKDGVDDDPLGWTDGVYSSTDEWIKISGTFDLDGAADYSEILVFIVAHNMAQESNPISELGRNYLLDDISLTKEGVCVTPTPEQNATPTTSPESNDDVQTGDTRMPIILLILVSAAIAIIVNYKRKEA